MNVRECTNVGEWKVLVPETDRLDAYVAEDFKRCLVEAVQDGTERLILDLKHVEFMDSSGLGAIVYCLQKMNPGARIAIAGARESVSLMLKLTHIDRVFSLVERPEDVLDLTT